MVIKLEGENRVTIWFLENNERGAEQEEPDKCCGSYVVQLLILWLPRWLLHLGAS